MQAIRLPKVHVYQVVALLLMICVVGWFVGAKSSAQAAIRSRVLANIAESKAAREATGFPVLSAKINQMSGGYLPDVWEMTTLHKGDVVLGELPGQSAYYTDLQTVLESGGDKAELGKILQIRPHAKFGYRPNIAQYEVLHDVRIPSGLTSGNPVLGVGMGRQFFIRNYSSQLRLIKEFDLEEFYEEQNVFTHRISS